jgi:protease I
MTTFMETRGKISMSLAGKTVAVLIAQHFDESEVIYPLYRLREEGATVEKLGIESEGTLMKSKNGVKFPVERSVNSADFDKYHAVVVPGGYAPDHLRSHERVQNLVHHVHSRGGVVAAICHGPWVLVSADLLKDVECTCYESIKDDIVNAGGRWQDVSVVVSNRIITSRCPDDLPDFCKAIISELSKLKF